MRVHVFLTAAEVEPAVVAGRTALVIDVIRATSTMVEALANGAAGVYPTRSTEDAMRLVASLGREDTLLCGERKGLKVDGFDLGNSPREFTRQRVEGKRLVMSTTNGTQAFTAAAGASRAIAASLLNLTAAAGAAADGRDLVVICAGKDGAFSLDDVLCAGLLLKKILGADFKSTRLNDAAMAALALADHFAPDSAFLRSTAAGRALLDIGLDADLDVCAQCDRHDIVPEMNDRIIRATKVGAS